MKDPLRYYLTEDLFCLVAYTRPNKKPMVAGTFNYSGGVKVELIKDDDITTHLVVDGVSYLLCPNFYLDYANKMVASKKESEVIINAWTKRITNGYAEFAATRAEIALVEEMA